MTGWCVENHARIEIATDGFQALLLIQQSGASVAVVDPTVPRVADTWFLPALESLFPDVEVVPAYLGLRGGAHGWSETAERDSLAVADRAIVGLQKELTEALGRWSERNRAPSPWLTEPTPRERQCAKLLVEGMGAGAIATILGLAEGTVGNYLSVVYVKLGVKGEAAARAALRQGSAPRAITGKHRELS